MIAKIHIVGVIGQEVTLIDVIKQVKAQEKELQASEYHVFIDSAGGYYEEGESIYRYLKSLKSKIVTVGLSTVGSIATVIFLAGDERRLSANTQFTIHNPYVEDMLSGDADYFETISARLRSDEEDMVKFYSQSTGVQSTAIKDLMKAETTINPQNAIELGFATSLHVPTYASIINVNKDKMNLIEEINKLKDLLGKKKLALTATSADGVIVTIEKANGEDVGEVEVGDKIAIDGSSVSGEILMADGNIVVAEAGVVLEIKPKVEEVAEIEEASVDVDAIKKENEELKAEIEKLKAQNSEVEAKVQSLISSIKKSEKFTKQEEVKAMVAKETEAKPVNRFAHLIK